MRAPMKARVHVTLKNGVLDPQGKAIEHALAALGFAGVDDVRQGKVIEFQLAERDPAKARAEVEAMCEQLLANTVIEHYAIELNACAKAVVILVRTFQGERACKPLSSCFRGSDRKSTSLNSSH